MQALNLPSFSLRIREEAYGKKIFDVVRKKYVVLTPEEWVRQHVIHFLVNEKSYPASLLAVEHSLAYNGMQKRCDIVAFNSQAKPILLVECKAASVNITQPVFEQIARYNTALQVPFLLVTNGMQHYSCKIDFLTRNYAFLTDVPTYASLFAID